jgi:hypothetical protein
MLVGERLFVEPFLDLVGSGRVEKDSVLCDPNAFGALDIGDT